MLCAPMNATDSATDSQGIIKVISRITQTMAQVVSEGLFHEKDLLYLCHR
jgi:hypothetical protein